MGNLLHRPGMVGADDGYCTLVVVRIGDAGNDAEDIAVRLRSAFQHKIFSLAATSRLPG